MANARGNGRNSPYSRLATPKGRRYNFAGGPAGANPNEPFFEGLAPLPLNPLPVWKSLPVEHKVPVMPSPKSATTYYATSLGKKIQKPSHNVDFDLADPNNYVTPDESKAYHDVFGREFYCEPRLNNKLHQYNFLTRGDKVVCTVKELNDYRMYMARIKSMMEKKKIQAADRKKAKKCVKPEDKDLKGMKIYRLKVQTIKHRLAHQFAMDRARFRQIMQNKEDSCRRLKQEQRDQYLEKERRRREEDYQKCMNLHNNRLQNHQRRLDLLRKWICDEEDRAAKYAQKKLKNNTDRERQLAEGWEERKKMQEEQLEFEYKQQQEFVERLKKQTMKRKDIHRWYWKKQREMFWHMTSQQRKEKAETEQMIAENLQRRVDALREKKPRVLEVEDKGKKAASKKGAPPGIVAQHTAHVIVDVPLYLTIRVIYPAYVRHLKEEMAEEYKKHIQEMCSPEEVVNDTLEPVFQAMADETYSQKQKETYKELVSRLQTTRRPEEDTTSLALQDAEELENTLSSILEELSSGKLKGDQVADLIALARTILDRLQQIVNTRAEAPSPTENDAEGGRMTEILTKQITQQTMNKFHPVLLQKLVEKYKALASEESKDVGTQESLINFIVGKVIDDGNQNENNASEADEAEQKVQINAVWNVLRKTASAVEKEIMTSKSAEAPSNKSDFVQNVLKQAVTSIVESVETGNKTWENSAVSLDRNEADMAFFVEYILNKAVKDIRTDNLFPPFLKISEKKQLPEIPRGYVQHLLDYILKQCLGGVNKKNIPNVDFISVTAAIISTHQAKRHDPKCLEMVKPESAPKNTPEEQVETFIKETVQRVAKHVTNGKLTDKEVKTLAKAFDESREAKESDCAIKLDPNLEMEKALAGAIDNLNEEITYQSVDVNRVRELITLFSRVFERVVNANRQLLLPLEPAESREKDVFPRVVLMRSLTNICTPVSVAIMPKIFESESAYGVESYIWSVINNMAIILATEVGLRYKPKANFENMTSKKKGFRASFIKKIPTYKAMENFIHILNSMMKRCKSILADSVENNQKKAREELHVKAQQDQKTYNLYISTDHVVYDDDDDDSDDDGNESSLDPTFHGRRLTIDHTVFEKTLSFWSVKKSSDLQHLQGYDAVPRNSFMSLQHPELTKVHRLSKMKSEKELADKITHFVSHSQSHLSMSRPSDLLDQDTYSCISTSSSESSISESDPESPESDRQVLSVQEIHNTVIGPDKTEPNKNANSSGVAEVSNKVLQQNKTEVSVNNSCGSSGGHAGMYKSWKHQMADICKKKENKVEHSYSEQSNSEGKINLNNNNLDTMVKSKGCGRKYSIAHADNSLSSKFEDKRGCETSFSSKVNFGLNRRKPCPKLSIDSACNSKNLLSADNSISTVTSKLKNFLYAATKRSERNNRK